ncbi:putative ribonuclease H-like domain-containing protein, partial [Tanacetum coccineum]
KGIFDEASYGMVHDFNNLPTEVVVSPIPTLRIHNIHPQSQILGDLKSSVQTRSRVQQHSGAHTLVWILVDLPHGAKVIGTKWAYRNKWDERGVVVRNKARLMAQGHRQEEGIDYDKVFALVARIEAIRLFLAFASFMRFIVYQMEVKSAFLYGTIDKEVYVSQPPGFVDPDHPKKVYKVVKALYGLHQAPRAWYATLSTFLEEHGYRRGTIDKTLFIKKDKKDIMLVQVYVDDIIFGSTRKSWCDEFEALMKGRFQMSSMGELIFFLGLQVKQKTDGIFISQDKYVADMLKKFNLASVKTAITPMETKMALTKDEEAADVDVHLYRSMIGSLMYLTASRPDIMFAVCACSRFQVTPKTSHLNAMKRIFKLISWQCKKQTIVATSTTEAEYVAAASCCGQVLWIQNQMLDYGFNFMNTKIHIDNESTICIVKNPVYHSKTKHIEIRHHFIRDSYEKKLIRVEKIHTDFNVADLLTKAFDGPRFKSGRPMLILVSLLLVLTLQVKQKTDGIFISQDKYVADMLKKFDLASVKTAITPMETKMALTKDEEADEVDVHLYRSMIGSLMYLTASRPDIMFAVCACSRFQVTPKTSHLNAVKRIFKYLKGKPNLGLWYPRESSFDLEAFSDSDYAGANLDRKSTTGGCQFLGSRLISWQCKKQTIVATSTTEAEYVAAASCCGQVLWIQNQMLDYGFNFMNTKIHIDNESTICIVKNPVYHSKTKHIEIRHHFIRDSYEKKLIRVEKIHTDFNVADLLTKAFDGPRFNFLVVNIGMINP